MGTCACCGTDVPGDLKLCTTCDAAARQHPCMGCTEATGRKLGCHDKCERYGWWQFCHLAVSKLRKDQEAIQRPTPHTSSRKRKH